jgi:hypothetical protein
MKIIYKIVWLDDQPDTMKKYISDIETILKENYFIPQIQPPFRSFEDFQNTFQTADVEDIYGEVFNDCDLLLIDYNIAEKQENDQNTGATLIAELRTKGIYTETVFYSNAMDEYRKKSNKPELDNVIYADKNELINKVEKLIKKNVVQSMVISNLRGYLMDCTSDFDFICRTVSEYFFSQLNDNQQKNILDKAEEYIHSQYKLENSKFEEINNKYKNICKLKDIGNDNILKKIIVGPARTAKLRKIFSSMESVICAKDKFRLMAQILQMHNEECYSNIYSYDDIDGNEKHQDKYADAIIKFRNELAHNKLIYGNKCKNRIKIIKILEDMNCECSENICAKSYSYDDCKRLRENIYNYYLLFNPLLEQVMSSIMTDKN